MIRACAVLLTAVGIGGLFSAALHHADPLIVTFGALLAAGITIIGPPRP